MDAEAAAEMVLTMARAANRARKMDEELKAAERQRLLPIELLTRAAAFCRVDPELFKIEEWAPTDELKLHIARLGADLVFALTPREPTDDEWEAEDAGEAPPLVGYLGLALLRPCPELDCGSYEAGPPLLDLADLDEQIANWEPVIGFCDHGDDEDDEGDDNSSNDTPDGGSFVGRQWVNYN